MAFQILVLLLGIVLTALVASVAFMMRDVYRRVIKFEDRFERLMHVIIRCDHCPRIEFD